MAIEILYFASIRETLGKEKEQLDLPGGGCTVAQLMDLLGQRSAAFAALASGQQKLLVSVNQDVVTREHALSDNDEVAFFPPMTGG